VEWGGDNGLGLTGEPGDLVGKKIRTGIATGKLKELFQKELWPIKEKKKQGRQEPLPSIGAISCERFRE